MTDKEPTLIQLAILIIRTWWRERKAKGNAPAKPEPDSVIPDIWMAGTLQAAAASVLAYQKMKQARKMAEKAQEDCE